MSTSVQVILPDKPPRSSSLEAFARRIEERFTLGDHSRGSDALEKHVCRLIASKDIKVSAVMTAKWVEWRYGRAKDRLEVTGPDGGPIEHTIKFADDNNHVPQLGNGE